MADKKVSSGLIKQLIREEVKVRLKNRLHEQDGGGYTFYNIAGDSVPTIKIAVKGNAIYSVVADKATGEFVVGKQIGGGTLSDFQKNESAGLSGVYLEGQKYIFEKTKYPIAYFSEQPNMSAYSFVFDSQGKPAIVGLASVNKKPVFTIATPEGRGGGYAGGKTYEKDKDIPEPTQPKTPEYVELKADFKFGSDVLMDDAGFTQQLTNYLNEFTKKEYQYLKRHQPLPLMVAASASIDTPNVKGDYDLTVDRVNAISRKIGEITQKNPNIPRFQVKPMPLGQTDRFAKGVTAPKYNRAQTAVNRKVIVGPIAKVNAVLNKYKGEINTGD